MNNDLTAFALRNTLAEIKNTCPEVSHTFIFTDNATIIARDEDTDEETATRAAESFNTLSKKADTIGGLETVTFYGNNDRVNIFSMDDFNLAMVTSKENDEPQSSAILARILIPTMLKLTEKIALSFEEESNRLEEPAFSDETIHDTEEPELQAEEAVEVEAEPFEEENEPQPLLPDAPITQFMVETLSGLLVASDTVRIDSAVIQQWKDLFGDKLITEVDLETLNGQTTRCKFKPMKKAKQEGKGTIQLPQKIQQTLQTSKGELIMVKPVID
jgi:predicted regulator of Ras-like GTPase activity (Roadblock/LC7/MglB family)